MSNCDSELIAVYLADQHAAGRRARGCDEGIDRRARRRFHLSRRHRGPSRHGEGHHGRQADGALRERQASSALASEEVAIRSIFPHEIDTFDPYEGEVRVWQAEHSSVAAEPNASRKAKLDDGTQDEIARHGHAYRATRRAHPAAVLQSVGRRELRLLRTPSTSTSTSAPSSTPAQLDAKAINLKIRELMSKGYGTIVVKNPGAKHGARRRHPQPLNLTFEGSLGYFGCGLIDGPNIRIKGRVGWSCAENMMAGTVVIEKNAGSTLRGGDARRRPRLQGRCRRARRHRPEGRHHHRRRAGRAPSAAS